MVRTGVLQEIRVMRFEEIYDRFYRGSLSASDASEWLGEFFSSGSERRERGRESEIKELHAKACPRA